jgi:hypothetical protein
MYAGHSSASHHSIFMIKNIKGGSPPLKGIIRGVPKGAKPL